MSRSIYDDERAYRAYMTMSDIYRRGLLTLISEVIAYALLIYLISDYSRPISIILGICLIAYVSWKDHVHINAMLKTMRQIENGEH